jgi:quercetin dioxygenase-like cupin family protein
MSEGKKTDPGAAGMPGAEAVRLADLVAGQDGSVVSRVVLKRPAGNVTLFAFDAGQGLSEHTAPFDALVQVLEGEAVLTLGGKAVPARAGEAVLMPANVPHALHAPVRFKMLLTMLRG